MYKNNKKSEYPTQYHSYPSTIGRKAINTDITTVAHNIIIMVTDKCLIRSRWACADHVRSSVWS
ncbi:hypothetical protein Ltuc_1959 [Legionella tucsonensis]|uniref:Uncharacterized protein n=1 Tax=Legionella tucsonensis TaxID=40335 RepID=A0A0W0ZZ29_9GAMM|nr:hypothetical protein Ltuc_1959 [Legionella tucsonensis]